MTEQNYAASLSELGMLTESISLIDRANHNGEETYTFIGSHEDQDRSRRTIDQHGWDLTNFRANPVITWAHSEILKLDELPIGKATLVEPKDTFLLFTIVFGRTQKATDVRNLVDDGIINAMSVIWHGTEQAIVRGADKQLGIHFKRQELWGASLVSTPSNPKALRVPEDAHKGNADIEITGLSQFAELVKAEFERNPL